MALIKEVRGFKPQIGKDCFLADNATVIGDTVVGDGCSIWFNAVLRGDVNSIRIGNHVNIQDGAVLHTLYEKSQIHILQLQEIGIVANNAKTSQKINTFVAFTCQLTGKVVAKRKPFSILEKSMNESTLPLKGANQFVKRTEMR